MASLSAPFLTLVSLTRSPVIPMDRTARQHTGRHTYTFPVQNDPPIPSEVILVISQVVSESLADAIGLKAGDMVTRLGPYSRATPFQTLANVAVFIRGSNSFTIEVLRSIKLLQISDPINFVKFEIVVSFAAGQKRILGCVLREVSTCHLQQHILMLDPGKEPKESVKEPVKEQDSETREDKKEDKKQEDKSPPTLMGSDQELKHCIKPIALYHPLFADSSHFLNFMQNLSLKCDK
jgi:hypothetical protein